MNVRCPSCATIYRVDPAKVPEEGVRARCEVCAQVFRVNGNSAVTSAVQPDMGTPVFTPTSAQRPAVPPSPLAPPPPVSATAPPPPPRTPSSAAGNVGTAGARGTGGPARTIARPAGPPAAGPTRPAM